LRRGDIQLLGAQFADAMHGAAAAGTRIVRRVNGQEKIRICVE
jgi:hypothetical protein